MGKGAVSFPPDAALALGTMLLRLDAALGPLPLSGPEPTGEIDGYDGLGRRGPYERLSALEWAIADLEPDEFLRRAASNEHAFFQLGFHRPGAKKNWLALFDTGPDQLGAPRLVHLVVLIALARRAEKAGARLAFASHRAVDAPATDLSPATIDMLLRSRTAARPRDGMIDLARLGASYDETWLVGSRWLTGLAAGGPWIEVREKDSLDVRTVEVVVGRAPSRRSPVVLDLPDATLCTRIIRDPLKTANQARARGPRPFPASNLLFAHHGRKIIARFGSGIVVYPVPNSPRAPVGQPRTYRPRAGELIAAGWGNKGPLMVSADGGDVVLETTMRIGPVDHGPRRFPGALSSWLERADQKILLPAYVIHDSKAVASGGKAVYFVTPTSELYRLHFGERSAQNRAIQVCERVTATALALESYCALCFVGRELSKGLQRLVVEHWRLESTTRDGGVNRQALEGNGTFAAVFGCPMPGQPPRMPAVAIQERNSAWTLRWGSQKLELDPPAGASVIGVCTPPRGQFAPGLVLLEEDRRTISLLSRSWSMSLAPAPSEVDQITVDSTSNYVAYTTLRGDLIACRSGDGTILLHVSA